MAVRARLRPRPTRHRTRACRYSVSADTLGRPRQGGKPARTSPERTRTIEAHRGGFAVLLREPRVARMSANRNVRKSAPWVGGTARATSCLQPRRGRIYDPPCPDVLNRDRAGRRALSQRTCVAGERRVTPTRVHGEVVQASAVSTIDRWGARLAREPTPSHPHLTLSGGWWRSSVPADPTQQWAMSC